MFKPLKYVIGNPIKNSFFVKSTAIGPYFGPKREAYIFDSLEEAYSVYASHWCFGDYELIPNPIGFDILSETEEYDV